MASAMSSAFLGVDAILKNLARRLTASGTWDLDELIYLTKRCHELAMLQGVAQVLFHLE